MMAKSSNMSLSRDNINNLSKLLLNHKFHLTALEFHTELLESGHESPLLRDFFSNPANFEIPDAQMTVNSSNNLQHQRASSVATFDSIDFDRGSIKSEVADQDKITQLEFELRKEKEQLVKFKQLLNSEQNKSNTASKEQPTSSYSENMDFYTESITIAEKRSLNYLLHEHMLKYSLKSVACALADEIPDQDLDVWEDTGIFGSSPPTLLNLYRSWLLNGLVDAKARQTNAMVEAATMTLFERGNPEGAISDTIEGSLAAQAEETSCDVSISCDLDSCSNDIQHLKALNAQLNDRILKVEQEKNSLVETFGKQKSSLQASTALLEQKLSSLKNNMTFDLSALRQENEALKKDLVVLRARMNEMSSSQDDKGQENMMPSAVSNFSMATSYSAQSIGSEVGGSGATSDTTMAPEGLQNCSQPLTHIPQAIVTLLLLPDAFIPAQFQYKLNHSLKSTVSTLNSLSNTFGPGATISGNSIRILKLIYEHMKLSLSNQPNDKHLLLPLHIAISSYSSDRHKVIANCVVSAATCGLNDVRDDVTASVDSDPNAPDGAVIDYICRLSLRTLCQLSTSETLECHLLPLCSELALCRSVVVRRACAQACAALCRYVSPVMRSSFVVSTLAQLATAESDPSVQIAAITATASCLLFIEPSSLSSTAPNRYYKPFLETLNKMATSHHPAVSSAARNRLLPSLLLWSNDHHDTTNDDTDGDGDNNTNRRNESLLKNFILDTIIDPLNDRLNSFTKTLDEDDVFLLAKLNLLHCCFPALCACILTSVLTMTVSTTSNSNKDGNDNDDVNCGIKEESTSRLTSVPTLPNEPMQDVHSYFTSRSDAEKAVETIVLLNPETLSATCNAYNVLIEVILPMLYRLARVTSLRNECCRLQVRILAANTYLNTVLGENVLTNVFHESCIKEKMFEMSNDDEIVLKGGDDLLLSLVPSLCCDLMSRSTKLRKTLPSIFSAICRDVIKKRCNRGAVLFAAKSAVSASVSVGSYDLILGDVLAPNVWTLVTSDDDDSHLLAVELIGLLVDPPPTVDGRTHEYVALAASQLSPVLVTLASSECLKVRLAAVRPALTIAANPPNDMLGEKLTALLAGVLDSAITLGDNELVCGIISGLGEVVATASSTFAEGFALPRIALVAAHNNHTKKRDDKISLCNALVKAYISAGQCYFPDSVVRQQILPGVAALRSDLISLKRNDQLNIIQELYKRLESTLTVCGGGGGVGSDDIATKTDSRQRNNSGSSQQSMTSTLSAITQGNTQKLVDKLKQPGRYFGKQ